MADDETLDAASEDVVEAMHGLEAIEESDGSAKGRLLPWDPRTKGPRDLVDDGRGWVFRHRIYLLLGFLIAVVGTVAMVEWFGLPSPSLPVWWDVAAVAGGIAGVAAYVAGKRTGKLFSNPDFMILDQLDAKTADQLTIKISNERWQAMTVYSHDGEERPTSYLKRKTWNGRPAVEVDRYYPRANAAIASWQAGASNRDLRRFETKVDTVKTELEAEANKAIESRVNAEEHARKQAQEAINELLAVYEGVTQPTESDLSDRLGDIGSTETESSEQKLDDVEQKIGLVPDSNGHRNGDDGDGDDALSRLAERAGEVTVDLDPRGDGGDDE